MLNSLRQGKDLAHSASMWQLNKEKIMSIEVREAPESYAFVEKQSAFFPTITKKSSLRFLNNPTE